MEMHCPLDQLGSIPEAFALKNVNAQFIKVIFGFVVILVGVEMLSRELSAKSANPSKGSQLMLGIIGLLSGILCGFFGVGVLLAAYVGRMTGSSKEFKANIKTVSYYDSIYADRFICWDEKLKQYMLLKNQANIIIGNSLAFFCPHVFECPACISASRRFECPRVLGDVHYVHMRNIPVIYCNNINVPNNTCIHNVCEI